MLVDLLVRRFVPDHQRTLPPRLGQLLTDPDQAVWEYSCGSSWQHFAHCSWSENVFVLTLGEHQLPITPTEEPGLEPGRRLRLREIYALRSTRYLCPRNVRL